MCDLYAHQTQRTPSADITSSDSNRRSIQITSVAFVATYGKPGVGADPLPVDSRTETIPISFITLDFQVPGL
jgi:hypothetical protein